MISAERCIESSWFSILQFDSSNYFFSSGHPTGCRPGQYRGMVSENSGCHSAIRSFPIKLLVSIKNFCQTDLTLKFRLISMAKPKASRRAAMASLTHIVSTNYRFISCVFPPLPGSSLSSTLSDFAHQARLMPAKFGDQTTAPSVMFLFESFRTRGHSEMMLLTLASLRRKNHTAL